MSNTKQFNFGGVFIQIEDKNPLISGVRNDNINSYKILLGKDKNLFYSYESYLFSYPTGNCQLGSFSYTEALIEYVSNLRSEIRKESIAKILVLLYKHCGIKNILLFDVKQSITGRLMEYIGKDFFISTNNYKSTNGSEMCIMLFNAYKFYQEHAKLI